MWLATTDLFKAHWTGQIHEESMRGVLAAAIRCGADAIVTLNLKDFPQEALSPFGIEALHPDDFVYFQVDMAPVVCCKALKAQRQDLYKPPMDVPTFLATLQKQQLLQTVSKLKEFIDFL